MFQHTKEYDTYRHELETVMMAWSRQQGIEIDKGMYLDNAPLESIAKLQFNPAGTGAGVAVWESADKGLSILICRPKLLGEVERVREREAALKATTNTLMFGDALKISSGQCKPPQGTYFDLKLLMNTFCALLWALFSDQCHYYQTLKLLRDTLDDKDVHAIREDAGCVPPNHMGSGG